MAELKRRQDRLAEWSRALVWFALAVSEHNELLFQGVESVLVAGWTKSDRVVRFLLKLIRAMTCDAQKMASRPLLHATRHTHCMSYTATEGVAESATRSNILQQVEHAQLCHSFPKFSSI